MRKQQLVASLSDSELLQLSAKGNEDAFLALYQRHQGPVFRFALHMSGCRETAEEVTQEVFMALVAAPKLYSPDRGALQAYLIGIARNKLRRQVCLDHVRVDGSAVFDNSASPLEGLSKEQEIATLRKAILNLPPAYREVIVLCDLENLDYAQTAQQLGCAIGTVRSRLHRARAILGARLRKNQVCPT